MQYKATQQLLIIDGNALMHRAFHALPDFTSKDGVPTNAVFGFATVMHKLLRDIDPTHMCVCFDTDKPTFRDALFEEYRTQRPDTDTALIQQFPIVREFLDAIGIEWYEYDGFEADDIIAAVAHEAEELHMNTLILTGDKDIFQLINDSIRVLTPAIGFSKGHLYDHDEVVKKFHITPDMIPDFKALVGDPSDNYKGVKGIGPKSAVSLLDEYKTIENLYANIESVQPERIKNLLIDNKKDALLAKELAVLVHDIHGFEFSIDAMKFSTYNEQVRDFFEKYNFRTLERRLLDEQKPKPKKVIEKKKEEKQEEDNQIGLF